MIRRTFLESLVGLFGLLGISKVKTKEIDKETDINNSEYGKLIEVIVSADFSLDYAFSLGKLEPYLHYTTCPVEYELTLIYETAELHYKTFNLKRPTIVALKENPRKYLESVNVIEKDAIDGLFGKDLVIEGKKWKLSNIWFIVYDKNKEMKKLLQEIYDLAEYKDTEWAKKVKSILDL